MFWNDPSLYSATLPYREIGNFPYKEMGTMPTPFMGPTFNPWQNVPKFIPPTFGALPYFDFRLCDPRMAFNPFIQPIQPPFVQPWMQTPAFNPFIQPIQPPFVQPWMQTPAFNPFIQPLANPFVQNQPINPFIQPFNVNPLHNLYRPFL